MSIVSDTNETLKLSAKFPWEKEKNFLFKISETSSEISATIEYGSE